MFLSINFDIDIDGLQMLDSADLVEPYCRIGL
jgi:hypothetical protein